MRSLRCRFLSSTAAVRALGTGEECGRNKLQSIPILLPSVNVGLEMLGFGLSQDVHIDGMYNWQTKRFSFMYISPEIWCLEKASTIGRSALFRLF